MDSSVIYERYPRPVLFGRGTDILYNGVRGYVLSTVFVGDSTANVKLACMRGDANVATERLIRVPR